MSQHPESAGPLVASDSARKSSTAKAPLARRAGRPAPKRAHQSTSSIAAPFLQGRDEACALLRELEAIDGGGGDCAIECQKAYPGTGVDALIERLREALSTDDQHRQRGFAAVLLDRLTCECRADVGYYARLSAKDMGLKVKGADHA